MIKRASDIKLPSMWRHTRESVHICWGLLLANRLCEELWLFPGRRSQPRSLKKSGRRVFAIHIHISKSAQNKRGAASLLEKELQPPLPPFMFRAAELFSAQPSSQRLTNVLVGPNHIQTKKSYGHRTINGAEKARISLLKIGKGKKLTLGITTQHL